MAVIGRTAVSPLCLLLTVMLLDTSLRGSAGIDLSLRFIKEPEDVVAKRNQSVILDCAGYSASEYGPLNFTWYHKGVLINDGRRQILTNGSLYIKRIRYRKHGTVLDSATSAIGAANSDSFAGEYYCAITNTLGTLLSRPAQLSIASSSRKFSVEPESISVEEGDVAQLNCQIQANPIPAYSWQRADQDASPDNVQNWNAIPPSGNRFTELPGGALQITGVILSDAGRYRCTADDVENTQTTTEASLQVVPAKKIYRSPVLLTLDSTVTVKIGEQAFLPCLASGYPAPFISWMKPDGHVTNPNLGQGNLVLKNVSSSDKGDYICTASNEFADTMEVNSVIQTIHLRVLVPPSFVERSQSIVGPLGITVRFECKVLGAPEPRVRWFKDGGILEGSRIKHKAGPYCSSLVILQTIMADSGIYQCVADNVAGYASVAARLQVNSSRNQPDPPTGLKVITRSSSSVELRWNASVPRNGLAIQAYTVHYYLATGGEENQKVTMNTSYLIENIQPYTNYTFYVRAYTGKSASEQSESLTWATGEDVPLGFPSVTLSSIRSTLYISWDELPSSAARGVIVGYKIHWRLHMHGSTNVIEVSGDVREFTVTGLLVGKRYQARVAACTKLGYPKVADQDWPWVSHEMARYVSADAPLPPVLHLNVVNSTAISAKWKITEDDSHLVIGYILQYHKQSHRLSDPIKLSANTTQYLLSDLVPHTRYDVHIFAYNRNGDGGESVAGIDTLPDKQADEYPPLKWSVVEPPTQLVAKSTTSTTIHLTWRSPLTNKNVSYYTVRYNPVNNSSMVNSSMVSYIRSTLQEVVITDLLPYTQYEFSVRSHDQDNKPGPYSNRVECKTLEDAPTAPLNVHWKLLDPQTIRLMWQPPKFPNGVIISYDIMYNTQLDPLFLFEKWSTIKEHGTESSSMVNGLVSNTKYYLCMRAETRAGPGALTEVITLTIPAISVRNHTYITPVAHEEFQDPKVGIIVGVSIGVCCMIICALIIVCRNRCFPPPLEQPHSRSRHWENVYTSSHVNGNGNLTREYQISSSEFHEMDSVTPMLTNIPDTISSHLDTKGGYPLNPPYMNEGVEPRGSASQQSNGHNGRHQLLINITENPQFDIKNNCVSMDANNKNAKRKSRPAGLSRLSPSSSYSSPLLDQSSLEQASSGSSEGKPVIAGDASTSTICKAAPNATTSLAMCNNHERSDQPESKGLNNGCSHYNRHRGTLHQVNNVNHANCQQHLHAHGENKRNRSDGCIANGTEQSFSSSNSLVPFHHRTTPKLESPQTSSAIITVTLPTIGGRARDGSKKRQRPLSHTAIRASPVMANGAQQMGKSPDVSARHSSHSATACQRESTNANGEKAYVHSWHVDSHQSSPSPPSSSSSPKAANTRTCMAAT